MTLNLKNNASKVEIELDVTDTGGSCMYYELEIELPSGCTDGEYTYKLLDDENAVVAAGILQIGDYVSDNTTYNNGKQEYITYGG
mgnify:CR=1 FL=1